MSFPTSYIRAGSEYSTLESGVPAPYFRKSFTPAGKVKSAVLTITGLGFYEVHFNGADITKGAMAPYLSNPDDYVYFDCYDVTARINDGKNVIAVILGNGMQDPLGAYIWHFDVAAWRGAPQLGFSLDIEYENGETESVTADTDTKTAPSPILFDDVHYGEYYDARNEIPDWDGVSFDDSEWKNAEPAPIPRGTPRICEAEPIVVRREIKTVSVTPYEDGFIYDFGENTAGLCRLTINGTAGQRIWMQHFELLKDGAPYCKSFRFDRNNHVDLYQEDIYYCSGKGTEIHVPRFTYHGFRYVYVKGITEKQAVPEMLTYLEMSSDIKRVGSFSCSDEVVNLIEQAVVRSDIANFYYFPTDCPHREKNGWTADAALSAEQLLYKFDATVSYREWMRNIYKAINDRGQLPGIIPTAGWGYTWGNGPAWDGVITELPYRSYAFNGDRRILEECAIPLMRYLTYLFFRFDENDLIHIGLGDWCQPNRKSGGYLTPLSVTDTILTADIAHKAAFIYDVLGKTEQKEYAEKLEKRATAAVRKSLINHETCIVTGNTQTGQAMAIFYGMFEESEKKKALKELICLIDAAGGHFDTGVLGGRVIFRVLAENGYADLAYDMITRPDFPSYGNWIKRGATTLWESFHPEGGTIESMNHHFWGDVSAWFYRYPGGMCLNPTGRDADSADIKPIFIKKLSHVTVRHTMPSGELSVAWKRENGGIILEITAPEAVHGKIVLPDGYAFQDKTTERTLSGGVYKVIEI